MNDLTDKWMMTHNGRWEGLVLGLGLGLGLELGRGARMEEGRTVQREKRGGRGWGRKK